jgi:hypothetical protein
MTSDEALDLIRQTTGMPEAERKAVWDARIEELRNRPPPKPKTAEELREEEMQQVWAHIREHDERMSAFEDRLNQIEDALKYQARSEEDRGQADRSWPTLVDRL